MQVAFGGVIALVWDLISDSLLLVSHYSSYISWFCNLYVIVNVNLIEVCNK